MDSENVSHNRAHQDSTIIPVDLRVVYVIVGALALFAPIYFSWGVFSDSVSVLAMTWAYARVNSYSGFDFMNYIQFMGTIPLTGWRLGFVNQIGKYYRGNSTRGRTVLVGIITEIPPLMFLSFMEWFTPPNVVLWSQSFRISTPFMLFAGMVFMWLTPFPIPKTPFDDRTEPDRWWQGDFEPEDRISIEPQQRADLGGTRNIIRCPSCDSSKIRRQMYSGMFGVRAGFYYSCEDCGAKWEG